MNKTITNKNLGIINFGIVTYFLLIYCINFFKIDNNLIGVFTEMLTIPFLLAQLTFLILGIVFIVKNKKKLLTIISVLALGICAFVTFWSFF
jgi:hypothetical protein